MFKLPPLPYAHDALEPTISADTLKLHHGKHHAKYVATTNELLEKANAKAASLEDVVRQSAKDPDGGKLHQNAAQAWNHAFFWVCMTPERSAPAGDLSEAIKRDFGGLEKLKTAFVKEGVGHFASGWVWLAREGGALKVLSTHDEDNLLTKDGMTPLIVCDLWEHAYYLDYQNDREGFLKAWFDALPNWSFAARQWQGSQTWRYADAEQA